MKHFLVVMGVVYREIYDIRSKLITMWWRWISRLPLKWGEEKKDCEHKIIPLWYTDLNMSPWLDLRLWIFAFRSALWNFHVNKQTLHLHSVLVSETHPWVSESSRSNKRVECIYLLIKYLQSHFHLKVWTLPLLVHLCASWHITTTCR